MGDESKPAQKTFGFIDLCLVVVMASIIGGVSSFYVQKYLMVPEEIDFPVAVVDLEKIIEANTALKQLPEGETLYGLSIKQAQELSNRLSASGYVVLKGGTLWATPEKYLVNPQIDSVPLEN